MYHALQTTLTLDDALALVEIDDVGQSWRAAAQFNDEKISDMIQESNGDGR